jgi:methyl-accepting chemotaxis protein
MAVKDTLIEVLKDLVLPELETLKGAVGQLQVRLTTVEQRLDDFRSRFQAIDQHLLDQSRRIDEIRAELTARIDQQTARIDQQAARIDALTAQVAAVAQEVQKLRQDGAVMADVLRRLAVLESKVAA